MLSLNYNHVHLESFGYELPPNIVISDDLEDRLTPLYQNLRLQKGQLAAITGVHERRFWDRNFRLRDGAVSAGKKALAQSDILPADIGMLVYGGVCRENLEPATACAVAHDLGLGSNALIYDVSNACLGVINGMIQVADAIELGRIRAGLVVSCESAREIVDVTIGRMLQSPDMNLFKKTVATLTGGSGAAAVLLTSRSLSSTHHSLMGVVVKNDVRHHGLCTWGPDTGIPPSGPMVMNTDSVEVLKYGVQLGIQTHHAFLSHFDFDDGKPDKIICHQVGSAHQKKILDSLGIPGHKDFTTYKYLGNIGTVSLPITAAIAEERDFFDPGDIVGLFGIGSGLHCMMLAVTW